MQQEVQAGSAPPKRSTEVFRGKYDRDVPLFTGPKGTNPGIAACGVGRVAASLAGVAGGPSLAGVAGEAPQKSRPISLAQLKRPGPAPAPTNTENSAQRTPSGRRRRHARLTTAECRYNNTDDSHSPRELGRARSKERSQRAEGRLDGRVVFINTHEHRRTPTTRHGQGPETPTKTCFRD